MRTLLCFLIAALLAAVPAWADTTPAAPVRTVAGKRPVGGDVPITAGDVGALSCIGTCVSWPTFLGQLAVLIPTASAIDVRTSISDAPNGADYLELLSGTIRSGGPLATFVQTRYGLNSAQMAAIFTQAGATVSVGAAKADFPPITTYLDTLIPATSTPTAVSGGAANFALTFYDVRLYRQPGDSDDAPAVNRAFAACYAGDGGYVWFPPQGVAYNIGSGIVTTGNGCTAKGVGIPNWPGTVGTKAQWTASGSWVACNDTVNPCFDFHGSGAVEGLNFWWDQPAPSPTAGTSWTPTAYPYAIVFRQQFSHARDVFFADAYQGLDFEYPGNANIAGTYSGFSNIYGGAFRNFIRVKNANDTMRCDNTHDRTVWNAGNPNMVAYQEANEVGWDIQYWDNPACTAAEFYKDATAILFTDSTTVYGTGTLTHACANCLFTDFDFNQVAQAVSLATGATSVAANFVGGVAQSDTDTNVAASYFFNLASNNVDVLISGMRFGYVGNSVFIVGASSSGNLRFYDSSVLAYGYFGGAGTHVFTLATGSKLDIPGGTQNLFKGNSSAGSVTGCAAAGNCGAVLAVAPATTPTGP